MENQTIISANRKELLGGVLFRERAEFSDPENKKILGMSAKTKILGFETVAGAVKVDLKTTFRLVSRAEDGTFRHDIAETEQTETITDERLTPTSKVCLFATVTETKKSGGDPEATVEISGWFIADNQLTVLNACVPGVYCKTAPFKAETATALMPGGLSLTYTDESRMNVDHLVDFAVEANVTNVFSGAGSYRIEGDIYIRIFAQSDDGQCFSQMFTHSFGTEISDERITPESDVDIDVTVKSAELSLADGDKRLIICDVGLSFCGAQSETIEKETIVDAFSPTEEITVKSEEKTVTEGFCLRSLREKITGKLTPVGGINELFGILDPAVSVTLSSENGSYCLEGVLQADVLYLSDKDVSRGQTAEIPFRIPLAFDTRCDSFALPSVIITNVAAKSRGGEVDLSFEAIINVKGVSEKQISVVSEIETGAPKEEDDFAISLYIVQKGETLWDVAKALNTSEETLLRQNADVPLPLSGGEKVILYRELPFEQ